MKGQENGKIKACNDLKFNPLSRKFLLSAGSLDFRNYLKDISTKFKNYHENALIQYVLMSTFASIECPHNLKLTN